MRSQTFIQVARYGITGVLSAASYIGLLWTALHVFPTHPWLVNAAAYLTVTAGNYIINSYWSFKSGRPHREASWRFLAVVALGVGLNNLVVNLLRVVDVPMEMGGLVFCALWPLVSFPLLRNWAFAREGR